MTNFTNEIMVPEGADLSWSQNSTSLQTGEICRSWFKHDFQENGPQWYMVFMAVKLGILFCHAKHDFQESGLDAQPYFLWGFFWSPKTYRFQAILVTEIFQFCYN
jgi:hypothetical protein